MATALSYPTISGVTAPPYLSALSEVANIQNTINFLYYGSTDAGTTPRTSLSTSSGIYGMLAQLQNQISSLQSGINVHENAKYATAATITGTYSAGSTDNSATPGTGINAYITFTATGAQSIDGGSNLILGDRVLVKNGTTIGAAGTTTSIANGIYVVQSDGIGGQATLTPTFSNGSATKVVLVRSTDANNSSAGDFAEGDFLYISEGSTNSNEAFMLTTASATGGLPTGTIRIGTDTVTYNQFIGVGSYYIGTTAAQISSANQALTGISSLAMPGATSGTITLTPTAIAGTTALTLPARNGETLATTALAGGGTNASLTASTGGIVYSTASAMAILAGTATAGKLLRSGATAAPTWSTATFPDTATGTGTILRADGTNWVATTATYPTTTTVSQILYSSSANVVSGLATANNGVLITSGTGVPSISTSLPANLTLTTPTIDTINTSLTTTGTAALWNTGLTTGTISIGGALTTGTVNIASSTAGAKTVSIGTSTGTVNINGTANVGKALLQTVTTTAGASTLTFSGISQAYDSLEVVYTIGTASTSTTTLSIQFAGDTATNYAYTFQQFTGNTSTSTTGPNSWSNGFDQTAIVVPMNHPDTTAIGSFRIDNYASTAGSKIGFYNGYYNYIADAICNGTFVWKNRTTAVTSMTLTFGGTVTGQVVTAQLFGVA